MEPSSLAILSKLSPELLLVVIVLYGLWRIAQRLLDIGDKHGEKISGSLEGIRTDMGELKGDIKIVASRVTDHEARLDDLERK